MGWFYTDYLKDGVTAGSLNGVLVTMHLMARSPSLEENDARTALREAELFSDFTVLNGWEEVSADGYTPQGDTVTEEVVGANHYIVLGTSLVDFPAMDPSQVQAVVFTVAGTVFGDSADARVLFGTTTPFPRGVVFRAGDGITAREDTTIGDGWLFGWAISGGTVNSVVEGTTVIAQGAPEYEVSHVHHLWLLPQRVNYIANPSFEGGVTHWQGNNAVTRENDVDHSPSTWVGFSEGAATSGVPDNGIFDPQQRLYLKSAPFFPRQQDMTFQLKAMGEGIVRVGLLYFPRDYIGESCDWGLRDTMTFQEWPLAVGGFTHMQGVRRMSDGYEAALLVEVRPTAGGEAPSIYFDHGFIEDGFLVDWSYFDGDSTFGAPDDFSWYGNVPYADKRGKSFSLWYNNRRAISGRLFGRRLDDTAMYTSADEQLDSLVTQWTPAGAVVIPHWDVLSEGDMGHLPVDLSATPLDVTTWPEQSLPFRIVEVLDVTPTSVELTVVGEGAYPVSGAYVVIGGSEFPVVITREPYDPSELYILSQPMVLTASWDDDAAPGDTLYLVRGNIDSPLSFVTLTF